MVRWFFVVFFVIGCVDAKSISKPDVIFLDWDGTISDNTQQLGFAFKMSLKKHGFRDVDLKKVIKAELEGDYYAPWEMAEKQLNKVEFDKMEQEYHNYYFDLVKTEMYSEVIGVRSFLEACKQKNIPMIVLSGRDGNAVRKESDYRDWNKYFLRIYGERDFGKFVKPDIKALQMAAKTSKISYNSCWYIGDTNTDIQMAINANCIAFYVGDPSLIHKKYLSLIEQKKLYIANYKEILGSLLL